MSGLLAILEDRWDLVEADFQHYYHLDLRVEARRTGVRRLCALVHGLPPDAATRRLETWSRGEQLAAAHVEVTDMWGRVLAQVWGAKASQLPEPIDTGRPRPPEPPKRVETDPLKIAAWFRGAVSTGKEVSRA